MVVLTHAHAAKAMLGQGYDQYSRQRRNIVVQLIKQAAGSAQVCMCVRVCMCGVTLLRCGIFVQTAGSALLCCVLCACTIFDLPV